MSSWELIDTVDIITHPVWNIKDRDINSDIIKYIASLDLHACIILRQCDKKHFAFLSDIIFKIKIKDIIYYTIISKIKIYNENWYNGEPYIQCISNGIYTEYKQWYKNGNLHIHYIKKNGVIINNTEYNLKGGIKEIHSARDKYTITFYNNGNARRLLQKDNMIDFSPDGPLTERTIPGTQISYRRGKITRSTIDGVEINHSNYDDPRLWDFRMNNHLL